MLVAQVFLVFQQVFICLTLSLRTYALYGCSRRLLKWMAIVGLALGAGALVCVREELWALQSAELLGGIVWT